MCISPFLDGNDAVARLFTQGYFIRCGLDGVDMWSLNRALAWQCQQYRTVQVAANARRRAADDGTGHLSARGLSEFCDFFLKVSLDEIRFMDSLLDPVEFGERIFSYVEGMASTQQLHPASAFLLRDVLLRGEVARGDAGRILAKPERTARRIVAGLLAEGLLVSDTPKGQLRLGLPPSVVAEYFPGLYPGRS